MTEPYYEHAGITIYHGDCREILPNMAAPSVVLTDPPYGIDYKSSFRRLPGFADSIAGDSDTSSRDAALALCGCPGIVFGTWKTPPPAGTRTMLIWDTGGALGMGALDLPWKPSWQAIYIIGKGFTGKRDGGVLRFSPVQSMSKNGRVHPHQKPLALMGALLGKCPAGVVLDPFMGSGSTLVASKNHGRRAVGIELDEKYCEIAAQRLSQEVMFGVSDD